jgi:hypothetical protein
MKKIFTVILMIISLMGFSQKQQKEDSLYGFVLALSYQPAIGVDMYGGGIYLHNIVSGIGLYFSMDGLTVPVIGDKDSPIKGDKGTVAIPAKRNWSVLNFGITIKTATNFYLYCGYSTGAYTDWETTTYVPATGTPNTYTVVTGTKLFMPGVDFGAIYYAGIKGVRFGIQAGFNTGLKTTIVGIQLGGFFKRDNSKK